MLEDTNLAKERKAEDQCINEDKQREESESRISPRLSLDQQEEEKDIDSCKSFYSNSWMGRYQAGMWFHDLRYATYLLNSGMFMKTP